MVRQRLVGAAVILSAIVIVVPLVLNGPVENRAVDVPTEIPVKPFADASSRLAEMSANQNIPKPTERKPVVVPDASDNTVSDSPQIAEAEVKVDEKAIVDRQQGSDINGWTVQVGSFSSSENALGLRDRLRSKNYNAYVESVVIAAKKVYRVRVGPDIDREKLEKIAAKISADEKLQAMVVAHP